MVVQQSTAVLVEMAFFFEKSYKSTQFLWLFSLSVDFVIIYIGLQRSPNLLMDGEVPTRTKATDYTVTREVRGRHGIWCTQTSSNIRSRDPDKGKGSIKLIPDINS